VTGKIWSQAVSFLNPCSWPSDHTDSHYFASLKINNLARSQWLTPVILATQEAEIRRMAVRSLPGQIVLETLSRGKKKITKKGWWSSSRCWSWVQTPAPQKINRESFSLPRAHCLYFYSALGDTFLFPTRSWVPLGLYIFSKHTAT
jgi:hypothetical protein